MNGIDIEQRDYVDDDNLKDEWLIINATGSTVHLEGQQTNMWCWVASARMASFKYMDSPISQASAAVKIHLGIKTFSPQPKQIDSATMDGGIKDVERALEYILGYEHVYSAWHQIYTEAVLQSLLDASYPVIISKGLYDNSGKRISGHDVVINSYRWDSLKNDYVYEILNPSPVNAGRSYYETYEIICDQRNDPTSVLTNSYIWEAIIIYEGGDYLNTVSWTGF